MSANEVVTTVKATGAQAVEADIKRLTAATTALTQAGQRSAEVQSRIVERQKAQAAAAQMAGKQIDVLGARVAGLSRGLATLSPVLGDGAMKFAGFANTAGDVSGALSDFGPRLDTLRDSLKTVNASGTLVDTTMSKLVPTTGQLTAAVGGMAAAYVFATQVITPMLAQWNSLDHAAKSQEQEMLKNEKIVERLNALNAKYGTSFNSLGEAKRYDIEQTRKLAEAQQAVTDAVMKGDVTVQEHMARLMSLKDTISGMTDEQLVRYRNELTKATDAMKAQGFTVDETAAGLLKMLEIRTKEEEVIQRLAPAYQTAAQAQEENAKAQESMRAQLDLVSDASDLSEQGMQDLTAGVLNLASSTDGLGLSLDENIISKMKKLGVNLEDARAAMDRMKGTGEDFATAMESISGGIDWQAQGDAIHKQWEANLKAQQEAWKKQDEERAAFEKESINSVIEEYKTKWNMAIDETSVYWSNQFDHAVVSVIERGKQAMSQIGSALAAQINKTNKQAASSGGGGGSSSGGGGDAAAAAQDVMDLEKALKRKSDEYAEIERHFYKGGAYKEVMAKRRQEIADLEQQIRKAKGQKATVGDKLNDKWNNISAEMSKSPEQAALEKQLAKNEHASKAVTKAVTRAAVASERQVAIAERQASNSADIKGLLMDSGATEREANRLLASMAKSTKLPDAFSAGRSSVKGVADPRASGKGVAVGLTDGDKFVSG